MDNYNIGSLVFDENQKEEFIRIVSNINEKQGIIELRNLKSKWNYKILRGYTEIYPIPFTIEFFQKYFNIYPIWSTQNGFYYYSSKFNLSINFAKDKDKEGIIIRDYFYEHILRKVKYVHEFQNLIMGLGFNPLFFEYNEKEQ